MCDFTQAAGVLQPTLRHQPAPGSESVEKGKDLGWIFPLHPIMVSLVDARSPSGLDFPLFAKYTKYHTTTTTTTTSSCSAPGPEGEISEQQEGSAGRSLKVEPKAAVDKQN